MNFYVSHKPLNKAICEKCLVSRQYPINIERDYRFSIKNKEYMSVKRIMLKKNIKIVLTLFRKNMKSLKLSIDKYRKICYY